MKVDRRRLIAGSAGFGLIALASSSSAQTAPAPQESEAERRNREKLEDFAGLKRYAADNAAVKASGRPVDIVFMGDSITEGWVGKRPAFFTPGRIGRGISGQTTPQMVLRMMADVVALRPRFVHIMAATNDIAGNTGPMTTAQSQDNFRMMVAIAKANRIKVLLASTPPADGFPWRPGLATVPRIRELNEWFPQFARAEGLTFVDYTPVLADAKGAMKPGLAHDGVHPGPEGYALIESVLTPLLVARKA
ncbi:GDSL-type esterase/lipase family protein [Sphingomonas sp. HF-S3]|uniref:GDSL-type esterase/lipase family protein n=1 Tax=Sphingomonas rustica TaxID=3103142 RepID=A0ABV0B7S5_9SPHN